MARSSAENGPLCPRNACTSRSHARGSTTSSRFSTFVVVDDKPRATDSPNGTASRVAGEGVFANRMKRSATSSSFVPVATELSVDFGGEAGSVSDVPPPEANTSRITTTKLLQHRTPKLCSSCHLGARSGTPLAPVRCRERPLLGQRDDRCVELPPDPTYDWPSVFKPGDVVRSGDGRWIGVVLPVEDYSEGDGDPPHWELHVDAAKDGEPQGVGIWEPWLAVLAEDEEGRTEVTRLGLRSHEQ